MYLELRNVIPFVIPLYSHGGGGGGEATINPRARRLHTVPQRRLGRLIQGNTYSTLYALPRSALGTAVRCFFYGLFCGQPFFIYPVIDCVTTAIRGSKQQRAPCGPDETLP